MNHPHNSFDVVTITLNPALDCTVTIPSFTAGAVNRVEAERTNPGGKGVNVAAALADSGYKVAATGFLGRDNTQPFQEFFQHKNIADRFIQISGQTRLAIKISDPKRQETTDINFPGAAPSADELQALSAEIAVISARSVVIAGSLPPGVEPSFYSQLIATLKARGQRVFLDTSGPPLAQAIAACPHVIKPNIHELEALLGVPLHDPACVLAAARKLIAEGIELVVVSMGKEGAWFVTHDHALIARPPDVEVLSTVGAGDAMVAGLVAAHLRGLPLDESARLATAFSVHALTRDNRTNISSILPQIIITPHENTPRTFHL